MKAKIFVKGVFPGPRVESLFTSITFPRLYLCFLNTVKLCIASLFESSKLNSGAEGMLQGVSRMFLIKEIKLLGHLLWDGSS
jgi:hypothetical protein